MEISRIISDPSILFGKPTFKGTRIPVEIIIEKISDGEAIESVLKSYPQLSEEDITEALAFVRDSSKHSL